MQFITLQTKNSTYQMKITDNNFLLHLYYGPKAEGCMDYLLTYYDRGFSGNPYDAGMDRTFSMDTLPQEYPCYGNGDYRSAAFVMKDENGVYGADLRYVSHRFIQGKYAIPHLPAVYDDACKEPAGAADCDANSKGADKKAAANIDDIDITKPYTAEITLRDELSGVEVCLKYGVMPQQDVITRSAVITNKGEKEVTVTKAYSAVLDFVTGDYDLLHFHGRHAMERIAERVPVTHSNLNFGSKRGTSSHHHNPFFILAEKETTEDSGSCYGMSFLYSGNFGFEAEKDQLNQTRMQMGLSDEMFEYALAAGETLYTPEVAMAFSKDGLTGMSHIYHKLIRNNICRGEYKLKRRPILINNWEATYMEFDGAQIVNIAREAKQLGVEMMVLDDGWFGNRNSDNCGLGDWVVNEEKMGGTLASVSEQIHEMGMKFGLWIEPEMVNEDSDLYRAHPDWAYTIPGRKPIRSRNQLVLDFSRKEVVDYIFNSISKVVDTLQIEYIKMDMNRSICDVYTAVAGKQNYGRIMHEYVLGVYDFLDRMLTRYPGLIIEGCSGGGGRFDAGMLYYTPQIWCSDDTDAIERITIQHGTSFGYPVSAVGSHVSAVPNHQTGRKTSMHTRGVVAMAGSFGYELDLNLISDEEKEQVKQQIEDFKKYWDLMHNGEYYRLSDAAKETDVAAWEFVREDGSECLLNMVTLTIHANSPVNYVKCKGLKADKTYICEENGAKYPGSALMSVGVPVPVVPGEYNAWQMHFVEE